jgi:hypothetical protein
MTTRTELPKVTVQQEETTEVAPPAKFRLPTLGPTRSNEEPKNGLDDLTALSGNLAKTRPTVSERKKRRETSSHPRPSAGFD